MDFLNDNISGPQPRGAQTPRCTFEEGELSAEASGHALCLRGSSLRGGEE